MAGAPFWVPSVSAVGLAGGARLRVTSRSCEAERLFACVLARTLWCGFWVCCCCFGLLRCVEVPVVCPCVCSCWFTFVCWFRLALTEC